MYNKQSYQLFVRCVVIQTVATILLLSYSLPDNAKTFVQNL